MKISRLIEILAQYLQEQGDKEILLKRYDDIMKDEILDDLDEMDLNITSDRTFLIIGRK